MARGGIAKEIAIQKIIEAFGEDYVAIVDKKIYVTAMENGEAVQVAISLTCPKNPISVADTDKKPKANLDWSGEEGNTTAQNPIEISPEDNAKIEELMRKLGITD